MGETSINLLVAISAANLFALLAFGYKVVRFINTIEFKTDLMWEDYEFRNHGRRKSDYQGHITND